MGNMVQIFVGTMELALLSGRLLQCYNSFFIFRVKIYRMGTAAGTIT